MERGVCIRMKEGDLTLVKIFNLVRELRRVARAMNESGAPTVRNWVTKTGVDATIYDNSGGFETSVVIISAQKKTL